MVWQDFAGVFVTPFEPTPSLKRLRRKPSRSWLGYRCRLMICDVINLEILRQMSSPMCDKLPIDCSTDRSQLTSLMLSRMASWISCNSTSSSTTTIPTTNAKASASCTGDEGGWHVPLPNLGNLSTTSATRESKVVGVSTGRQISECRMCWLRLALELGVANFFSHGF